MKKKITRSYMSKALLSTAIAAVIPLFFVSEAKAGINVFFPDGYENSAAMSMTSKFDLTLGNSFVQNRSKYKGTTYGVTGQSSSTLNTPFMPHGHLLYRISPDWVVGLYVSQPNFLNYFKFKSGPLIGLSTQGHEEAYSPKISYKVNDQLDIGAGLDVYNIHGLKLVTPFGPMGANGSLTTRTKGHAVGWDVGLMYKMLPTTWVFLDYYSKAKIKTKGTANGFGQSVQTSIPIPTPATTSLSVLQFLSKEWLVKGTVRYIQSNVLKDFVITNTPGAGRFVAPLKWKNNWDASLFTRYQFASQWAGMVAVEYYSNPTPQQYNSAGLPSNALATAAVGVQYMPTKETQIQLFGGYGGLNPKVNAGGSIGKMPQRYKFVDLTLSYKF